MFDAAKHAETLKIMGLAPVIPVLTVRDVADGVAQARALVAGGLLRDRGDAAHAGGARRRSRRSAQVPGAYVGAGTIVEPRADRSGGRGRRALSGEPRRFAGARDAAGAAPIPFLPGVATPSEAMELRELGFRALKLFPAEAVGGARLLASLSAPLPDLVFCPTGGIDLPRRRAIWRCPTCYASAAPGCCRRRRSRRAITRRSRRFRARGLRKLEASA